VFVLKLCNLLLLAENLLDLLGGLLLGDAVLLSDLVGKTVLVALDSAEVLGGELVELLAESVPDVLHSVGHVDCVVI
jgi:hypothetical protein